MGNLLSIMYEALQDVLDDTENGLDITGETYMKVKGATEYYHQVMFEEITSENCEPPEDI